MPCEENFYVILFKHKSSMNVKILICSILLGIVVSVNIIGINLKSRSVEISDYYAFYYSARSFLEGESIYKLVPYKPSQKELARMTEKSKQNSEFLFPNMNAPLHTLFMLPFAILPLKNSFLFWSITSIIIGLVVSCLIASNTLHLENRTIGALVLMILLFGYFPTIANIIVGGQWGLCMLGFVVLIWLTSRNEKHLNAGIILGFAISLKIIFGLYLLLFLVRRDWKLIIYSLIMFFISNTIGLFIFGAASYKEHLANLEMVPKFINASWNASSAAFFTRILGGAENIPLIMMPDLAYTISFTFSAVLVFGIIWSAWSQPKRTSLVYYDIGFSLTTVSMLLISPVGWMYYFPILLLPAVLMWIYAAFLEHKNIYRSAIVSAWIISSIPSEYIPPRYTDMNDPIVWFTSAGYYFYALTAFSIILFFILGRLRTENISLTP